MKNLMLFVLLVAKFCCLGRKSSDGTWKADLSN